MNERIISRKKNEREKEWRKNQREKERNRKKKEKGEIVTTHLDKKTWTKESKKER